MGRSHLDQSPGVGVGGQVSEEAGQKDLQSAVRQLH
jgi:hypothetical protein